MSMHELKLMLQALDPLVVSSFAGSETSHATLDYLPGSALLGALASAAVEAGWDTAGPQFRRCFLLGEISFGDGNPSVDGTTPSVPAPRSWATIKGQQGFAGGGDRPANVFDLAVCRLMHPGSHFEVQWKALLERGLPGLDSPESAQSAKLEDVREGYIAGASYFRVAAQVRSHTAIEPGKRSSAEGQLYSYESIPAGTRFMAGLRCTDKALLDRLAELVKQGCVLGVGRARSAGYGRVRVNKATVGALELDGTSFSGPAVLTLHSDVVLPHGCRGIEDLLQQFHGIGAANSCRGAWALTRTVQAFHGQWGLPRDTAVAITRGSVFLLELDEQVFNELAALRSSGVGLRTHEGFGRFSLNHPGLHGPRLWRDEVAEWRRQAEEDKGGSISRPDAPALRPALERWLQRQAEAFAERLLFTAAVTGILDSEDLIKRGQPSNSQLNALRVALAGGKDKARGVLKEVKNRASQWSKWDNCHVTSHFHGGTYGFGAYMATLLEIDELAEKPRTGVNDWIAHQLKADDFGRRISDGLRKDFIDIARTSFIDQLIRSIVARRRIVERKAEKEAAHA